MRQSIFNAVVRVTELSIKLSDWIFAIPTWVVLNLGLFSRSTIAKIGLFGMRMIDRDQLEAIQELNEVEGEQLHSQQTELELLSAASTIRDHYMETGEWTPEHTMALEAVSNKLLNDCGWEEDDIHAYMRRVVEADGTGLSYDLDDGPW
jgi:hypothetical protein